MSAGGWLTRFEQWLAGVLQRFPAVKATVKSAYYRVNLALQRTQDPCILAPGVGCRSVWDLVGVPCASTMSFYGYYDRSPWSPNDDQQLLLHVVDTDLRCSVSLFDFRKRSVSRLAHTAAWNWQQGAMAQWLCAGDYSGSIIFNAYSDKDHLTSRILSSAGELLAELPMPIQAVHPEGHGAYGINYRRIAVCRPDYGYERESKNLQSTMSLADDGLWWIDFRTGEAQLMYSLSDIQDLDHCVSMDGATHEVNHVLFNASGQRCVFMHRWYHAGQCSSRLLGIGRDGQLIVILQTGMVSHYCWANENELIVWGVSPDGQREYFTFDIENGEWRSLLPKSYGGRDGHPTVHPVSGAIAYDQYPDRKRRQHLYVLDAGKPPVLLASLYAPLSFQGTQRCDLHPRWDASGQRISIDASFSGTRQSYIVDRVAVEGSDD